MVVCDTEGVKTDCRVVILSENILQVEIANVGERREMDSIALNMVYLVVIGVVLVAAIEEDEQNPTPLMSSPTYQSQYLSLIHI